jgi:phenylalanyl-tRNA synthetase beta chain
MRFSEAWLREWVNPGITTEQLAEQLTMAGLEVDAVEPAAPPFSGVRVGQVLDVQPHPDADKLRVCSVDVGESETLQIICGAANVAADVRVPVATVGGTLPGDFKIKKARLRGVESFGMICSAAELGLAEISTGIMLLPQDAPVGVDLRTFLDLDDACIEVDLTPNRGDCLSVAGLAREVGVLNRSTVTPPTIDPVAPTTDAAFPVRLEAPQACPRYACRIIQGIDPQAPTPRWMRERLRRSGIRSLGPVVDVTNYVLLELGQPMHGFDLGCIKEEIRIREAKPGERVMLLNGEDVALRDGTLIIADVDKPLALAGIMGGESSAVTEATSDVLLESAFFSPTAIIGKARSYSLHTDSSHRFERGVDPQLQVRAMERATALLLDIVGGDAGPVVEVVAEGFSSRLRTVSLRRQRLARILGVQVDDGMVADILSRLGMTVEADPEGWGVTPPSARFDIAREEDLIEEVGRIYGYDRIPAAAGAGRSDSAQQRPDPPGQPPVGGNGSHASLALGWLDRNGEIQSRSPAGTHQNIRVWTHIYFGYY